MKKTKKILLIIIFMLSLCLSCQTAVYAKEDTVSGEKDTIADINKKAKEAYQEFLDGERKVYIKDNHLNNISNEEKYTISIDGCDIRDILESCMLTKRAWLESYPDNAEFEDCRIISIEYAYMDYGNDGILDLAVKFTGLGVYVQNDDSSDIYVITYQNDKLVFCERYSTYARGITDLYYYGYSIWTGIAGAFSTLYTYSCPDAEGDNQTIVKLDEKVGPAVCYIDNIAYENVFGDTRNQSDNMVITKWEIDDKTYYTYEIEDDENKDLCEKFIDFCQKDGISFSTKEEIKILIDLKKAALGITDEWFEKKELDWQLYENPAYSDYVKEIALKEEKELRDVAFTNLKDKWTTCEQGRNHNIYDFFFYSDHNSVFSNLYAGVGHAIADYCKKHNASEERWYLLAVIPCKNNFVTVVVKSETDRVLCLLVDNDAAKLGVPEYTDYIKIFDSQPEPNAFEETHYIYEQIDIPYTLNQITMYNSDKGWALSTDNELLFTDSGIENFTTVKKFETTNPDHVVNAAFVNEQTICTAYFSQDNTYPTVEYTTDGGTVWKQSMIPYEDFSDICDAGSAYISFADAENGYLLWCSTPAMGMMTKLLFATEDGGKTFNFVSDLTNEITGYPQGISFSNENTGYIAVTYHGEDNYLYVTRDSGQSWNSLKLSFENKNVNYIDGYAPFFYEDGQKGILILKLVKETTVYSLFITTDGGDNWQFVDDLPFETLTNYSALGDNQLLFIDNEGKMFELLL